LTRTAIRAYQAFQKHIAEFYASPGFKAAAKQAEKFFKEASDFTFGRPTTLENAVRPPVRRLLRLFSY